jgi:hypothetical protein
MSDEDKVQRSVSAKKSIVDFISVSNRSLDELLTSGKVLFGDSISNYLEKIASLLLKDEPDLRMLSLPMTVQYSLPSVWLPE